MRTGTAIVFALALVLPACGSDGADRAAEEPRTGYGNMGLSPPPSVGAPLLGPEFFSCHSGRNDVGYTKYGVGRMRRGGLEREELEPNHIVIGGHGVNFHGNDRVIDGGSIEMEMDEDYFEPTVLRGSARSDRHDRARERGRPAAQLQRARATDRHHLRRPRAR